MNEFSVLSVLLLVSRYIMKGKEKNLTNGADRNWSWLYQKRKQ